METFVRSIQHAILGGMALLLGGCSDDPARAVKIISRPRAPAATVYTPPSRSAPHASVSAIYTPPPGPDRNLIPEFCPASEEPQGPGAFILEGPCAFRHRAPVSCEATPDDFIVAVPRKSKNGAMLVIYLNVEHYHGPGVYDGAQLFVALEGGTDIYRWSNDEVRATVGPGEAFVTLGRTRLDQEPMHVVCSRLIGPESNYTYQCAASSRANLDIDAAPEIVSGKLSCRTRASASQQ
jgi:hypothetical protein